MVEDIPCVRQVHDTPNGDPCPRTVRLDGTIEGTGACFACGTCLLFGDLLDAPSG